MFQVLIDNQTSYKFLYKKKFEKICQIIAEMLKFENYSEVNLIIVNNEKIHYLNQKYRNQNKPTDILSFPNDYKKLFEIIKYNILGDIYISYEMVKSQSKKYNHSLKREWCYLFTHGILHLLGYDHKKSEEETIMNNLTEKIMECLKITRE